jgi:hypothetical protein
MTPQRSAANTVRGADESDHANRRTKTRAGPWSANEIGFFARYP